jgi:hypothetical protein
MSERRKARAATVSAPHGGIPEPLLSRLHPIWKDPDRVRAAFPEYVHPTDFTPLSFRRLYGSLVIRWALANGYESEQYRGSADWHRLRAAGLGGPQDRPGDTAEDSRLARVAWLDDLAARWQQDDRSRSSRPSKSVRHASGST